MLTVMLTVMMCLMCLFVVLHLTVYLNAYCLHLVKLARLLVGLLARLCSSCSVAWMAALLGRLLFVCIRPPVLLFETLLCPFPPLSDELIKGIEMLLEISVVAPSRADVLMRFCSFLGIVATNTVRVRYIDK